MKILILGGTKFLGRHLTAAQARGHEVTLFNRGKYSSEKFPAVEQIHGDRNSDLDKLRGRHWDACIDTCGYLPQTVQTAAQALNDAVDQYVFISSISVYKNFAEPNFSENAPLAELSAAQKIKAGKIDPKAEINGSALEDMYGALKALCERAAKSQMPDRVLSVRSGLIVGAFDPTDRFTYWVMRAAGGGEILAPGNPERFVQLIDARDLSEWIIDAIERNLTGNFNVTGKPSTLTMGKLLTEIKSVTGSDAEFTWADEDFLRRENVAAWSEMPLYLPESDAETKGFLTANIDQALANNLKFRTLSDTIAQTFAWRKTKPDALKAGISAARERELLGKWRERH